MHDKITNGKRNNRQAAKCGYDLNRNYDADSLGFDMNLKTNLIGMISIIRQKWKDFSTTEYDHEKNLANTRLVG